METKSIIYRQQKLLMQRSILPHVNPNETIAQFIKKSIADYTAAKTNAEGQISNGLVFGFVKDNLELWNEVVNDENGLQTIVCGEQEKAALQRNTLKMKLNVRMNL